MQQSGSNFNRLVNDAIEIWRAGVKAVDGKQAVINCAIDPSTDEFPVGDLRFGELSISRNSFDRIFVVGAGKACAAMAQGLQCVLEQVNLIDRVADTWINVTDNMADTVCRFHLHAARPAGINLPTQRVVEGTNRIIELVEKMTERDLCICLISGGGSALLASPIHPVTLDDKRTVTERLSSLGADITQLNTVRKSISRVKGGQLANRCGGGQLVSLIMSDIIGDPVDFIASGPTVVSQDTRQEALRILDQFDPGQKQISEHVYSVLHKPQPKSTGAAKISNAVIANNAIAVDASGVEAVARGYDYIMTCDLDRDIDAQE